MPIVPVFGGGGGAAPSPPPGPVTPEWLDVPTVITNVGYTIGTYSPFTANLPVPTNGTGPFTYDIKPIQIGSQQTYEIDLVAGTLTHYSFDQESNSASSYPQRGVYRVVVTDSLGNVGVGLMLFFKPRNSVETLPLQVIETVLEHDVEFTVVPARDSTGVSAWYGGQPGGDGFMQPNLLNPTQSTIAQDGEVTLSCVQGSFFFYSYDRRIAGFHERVFLIVRRKWKMDNIEGWNEWKHGVDLAGMGDYLPSTPFTSGQGTWLYTLETNAETGLTYPLGATSGYLNNGTTPDIEECYVQGGMAKLSMEYTATSNASTRTTTMVICPFDYPVTVGGGRLVGLCNWTFSLTRFKIRASCEGRNVWAQVMMGRAWNEGVGIRLNRQASPTFYWGGVSGTDSVQIQRVQDSVANLTHGLKWDEWVDGQWLGVDIHTYGTIAWIVLYKWNDTWTDFPEIETNSTNFTDKSIPAYPMQSAKGSGSGYYGGMWGSQYPQYGSSGAIGTEKFGLWLHIGNGQAGSSKASIEVARMKTYTRIGDSRR